jgi:hypothetical protein
MIIVSNIANFLQATVSEEINEKEQKRKGAEKYTNNRYKLKYK